MTAGQNTSQLWLQIARVLEIDVDKPAFEDLTAKIRVRVWESMIASDSSKALIIHHPRRIDDISRLGLTVIDDKGSHFLSLTIEPTWY